MTAFTPTSTQLCDALEHIYYEIDQFLQAGLISTSDDWINNALLESSLVHVRALLDFFEKSVRSHRNGQELDDVLSIDYGFPSQVVPVAGIYRERLNKDLAHLTYSRTERSLQDKCWPPSQIHRFMLERIETFIDHLIQNFLPSNASNAISNWHALKLKVEDRLSAFRVPNALKPTGPDDPAA
jgi:hypothetical protein